MPPWSRLSQYPSPSLWCTRSTTWSNCSFSSPPKMSSLYLRALEMHEGRALPACEVGNGHSLVWSIIGFLLLGACLVPWHHTHPCYFCAMILMHFYDRNFPTLCDSSQIDENATQRATQYGARAGMDKHLARASRIDSTHSTLLQISPIPRL